jgi:hypothetical protein
MVALSQHIYKEIIVACSLIEIADRVIAVEALAGRRSRPLLLAPRTN